MSKAKLVVSVACVLALATVGCGGQVQATPTTLPDLPTLSEGEAIALVQEFAIGLPWLPTTLAYGPPDCYGAMKVYGAEGWDGANENGWDNAVASYEGRGRWLVSLEIPQNLAWGHPFDWAGIYYEWEVYEGSLIVRGLTDRCRY